MKPGKKLPGRAELVPLLALLEELVAGNAIAHQNSAAYHQSELVESAQENAGQAITEAVKKLASSDFEGAERLAAVAWFYSDFACGILKAEYTENQLGEGVYLDLVPPRMVVKTNFASLLKELKQLLLLKASDNDVNDTGTAAPEVNQ